MKTLIALISFISLNTLAVEMPSMKAVGAQALEKGKDVASACKSEQVEYCKAYTEMAPLKECLTKNKAKLSPACKTSIGL